MKIAILNPPAPDAGPVLVDPLVTRCNGIPAKAPYLWPPVGLRFLHNFLEKNLNDKTQVDILDFNGESMSVDKLISSVKHDAVIYNFACSNFQDFLQRINILGIKLRPSILF